MNAPKFASVIRFTVFRHILEKCVENPPKKEECYYWDCALNRRHREMKMTRTNAEESFLSNSSTSLYPKLGFFCSGIELQAQLFFN